MIAIFSKTCTSAQHRPTKRAPDAGDSGAIPSIFLRLSIFPVGRRSAARPSAGNANRWAVPCKARVRIRRFMSSFVANRLNIKSPKWLLFIGLTGVINFFVRAWLLLPPTNERTIFFWFAKFYQDLFFPSLAFLSIGIALIALWLSRITDNPKGKVIALILGIVASIVCLFPAFGTYAFVTTSYVFEDIKHNGYYQ